MKERLDVILYKKGFFSSREKAKASILAGIVYVDGQMVDKAGTLVTGDSDITVKKRICPYVSRGGLKLEKAMNLFGFKFSGAVCMDIGASTGGFTDCMLQNGAKKIYCVDVGYGQLDWKLRTDSRIVNMEKTNIRYLDLKAVDSDIDFISIDVSFISLRLVLPVASKILTDTGNIICLIKPQFEAKREQVGKKGIVKAPAVHREVIKKVIGYGRENGLNAYGLTFSPLKGAKGNIEYLLALRKSEGEMPDIVEIVKEAHEQLKK